MAFVKKKLQKIADKSMESSQNNEFKHKVKVMLEEKEPRKAYNRKFVWALSSVASLLLILCVVLCVVFPFQIDNGDKADNDNDIGYCEDFEKVAKTSIEELNGALQEVRFNQTLVNTEVQRVYDDVSNDTLMFIFRYENLEAFDSIVMHVITNSNYVDRAFADKVFDKSCQYKGHLLEYKETVENVDGFYEYNIEGKLTINEEIIYFTYQNFAFIEDSGMMETLDNIIQIYN